MCAIIDANVGHEVFGNNQSPAGKFFLNWLLHKGGAKLAVGGKLWAELNSYSKFQPLFADLLRRSKVVKCDDDSVNAEAASIDDICRSNDSHVIALARISGARLLYSNDLDLHKDFKNPRIINEPRGRIYTTVKNNDITRAHRTLLNRKDLCAP